MIDRLIKMIKNNPLNLFIVLWWNLKMLLLNLRGYKTLVYNIQYDYFFDIFLPVYEKLSHERKLRIFFSIRVENKKLLPYLSEKVSKNLILSSYVSPFIYFNLFVTAEINGPDFPLKVFPTKKIQMYHGTGTYTLYEKIDVLSRFDIHFAVGPQVVPFVLSLPYQSVQGDNLRKVGYPKLDSIVSTDQELMNKLKKLYGIDDQFVVLYTPHWNEFGSLHQLGLDFIECIARLNDKFLILVKVHHYLFTKFKADNWPQKLDEMAAKHPNIIIVKRPNTQEIYPLGDMLITDTGTTSALEYSVLNKPLFVHHSKEWFLHHQHGEVESQIIKTAITFTSCQEICQFADRLFKKDPDFLQEIQIQKQKQKKMVNENLYNPGTASKVAAQIIKKELNIL